MNTKATISVSGTHIIGMDYSLPVMEGGEVSALIRVPDRVKYSGTQSVSDVEDVPDFYFRVQDGLARGNKKVIYDPYFDTQKYLEYLPTLYKKKL
jgi:hypothetical protein